MAQPGTVIFMTQGSCLPGECGDNSTNFTVTVSGILLENLNTSGTSLKYAGRVPNFQSHNGVIEITFMTEYQIFRLPVFLSYRLVAPGVIGSVMPSSGQRGTRVTIDGTRLKGLDVNVDVSSVRIGSNVAEIIATSDSQIRVRARTGLPIGNESIRINSTQMFENRFYDGPYTYAENVWTQLQDGVATTIIPAAAQEGREIFICGTDILGGGSSVSQVQLQSTSFPVLSGGTANPPPFNILEPECIQVQVGLSSSTTQGIINVTSDTGAFVESVNSFTIANVDSISPTRGQVGTIVTIRGLGLLSGTTSGTVSALLSGVAASVIRSSSTEVILQAGEPPISRPVIINATTGATEAPPQYYGVEGGVLILVRNPYGTSSDFFNVSTATGWQLEVSGMINNTYPIFGQVGTRITISGTNLLAYGTGLTHVTVGGVNATILDGASNSLVLINAPLLQTFRSVEMILYSDTGASIRSSPQAFEYREPGEVTETFPNQGQNGTFGKL